MLDVTLERKVRKAVPPLRLRYCPYTPTPKQYAFLMLNQREVFYGGSAGGAKSWALLMAALQYVDVPGYSALILRRTYQDLSLPGALLPISHEWLDGTDAKFSEGRHAWTFPSGATLTFGYMDGPRDKERYQSSAYQFIGFDELTHFRQTDYTYMFSRCRRPQKPTRGRAPDGLGLNKVPLRVRSASNPGGYGHEWVYQRMVNPLTRRQGTIYLPARLEDNEHLDAEEYKEMFEGMGNTDVLRLLKGDWEAEDDGTMFKSAWFDTTDDPTAVRYVRYWDTAATEEPKPGEASADPDWTVGTLMGRRSNGTYVTLDVQRFRKSAGKTEDAILETAHRDGRNVWVYIQQEPGSAGKMLVTSFARKLPGFVVKAHRVGVDKETRAVPYAAALENGLVAHMPGHWIHDWISEHAGFPNRAHDDQVDSGAGAYEVLSGKAVKRHSANPSGRARVDRRAP